MNSELFKYMYVYLNILICGLIMYIYKLFKKEKEKTSLLQGKLSQSELTSQFKCIDQTIILKYLTFMPLFHFISNYRAI